MSAIVINDLTKGKGKDKILSNLNLEILDGEFFSLLGTDKSGKTTLARLLMGYLKASSGSIKLYDMDSFKESKEIKESVSFVPEDMIYDSKIKSFALLKKTLNAHNLSNTEDIDILCDYFDFNSNLRVCDLRDRERKLLAIINALVIKPRLLILDSPSKFLEEKDIERLFSHIKKLNDTENLTILLLSDSLREAKKYSSRIAYLSDGKVQDIEYNNVKASGDKVLRITSFRGNLNYFTSIGARILKDEEEETVLYFDGNLPELSKVIYEEGLENYVLEDAKLSDKVNAYYKGENAKLPRKNQEKVEVQNKDLNLEKENKAPETSLIGASEKTALVNEENYNKEETVNSSDMEKDTIHNTKTNLFVDEEYNNRVLSEDNAPLVEEETSTSEYLENVTDLDAKSGDTKVFDGSSKDIFNTSDETRLKEDKDDI